jgi:hypothetical protein
MAIIYQNEYLTKLQERLSEDNKWKRICRVEYTDVQVLHNPYLTDVTANTLTRGSAYTPEAVTTTDDTITINSAKIAAQYIDRADLAQKTFAGWMDLADNQGLVLNEAIETAVFAAHAQFTDFGGSSIGLGGAATDQITVSESNIDDIIRGVKRQIRVANGDTFMERYGVAFVWRPADFEKLEAYAQAQGFNVADGALKDGTNQGFRYMGAEHYSSNKLATNHVFAGVKNVLHLGICKSTYGQITVVDDPVVSGGQISGIGINSRVDYAVKAWSKVAPILFDINVA